MENKTRMIEELERLESSLKHLIKEQDVTLIKEEAHQIKDIFYTKYHEVLEEAKGGFINEGGKSELFEFQLSIQQQFKKTWGDFLEKKKVYQQKQEEILQKNLKAKELIVSHIKQMVDGGEHDYAKFKELLSAWKLVGNIPVAKYPEVSGNFHHQVERYYDLMHLNDELRLMDFKHNLDVKLQLIAKAKDLLQLEDVNFMYTELQALHRIWKDEVGPVAKLDRERVWNEFAQITHLIHQKRETYIDAIKEAEQNNLTQKLLQIKAIDALLEKKPTSFNEWKIATNQFEQLKEAFFSLGKIPKEQTQAIWSLFKKTTSNFNQQKNDFFKESKKIQQVHVQKRNQLIALAKTHKNSEELEVAANLFKQIQREWKSLPPISKKIADKMWNEFQLHCNEFFERLQVVKTEGTPEQQMNFEKKKLFLEGLQQQSIATTSLRDVLAQWCEIGTVSAKNKVIDTQIYEWLSSNYKVNQETEESHQILKYTFWKITTPQKLVQSFQLIKKKLEDLNKELKQLENNRGFFATASSDNPILATIKEKELDYQQQIKTVHQQLNLLKKYL